MGGEEVPFVDAVLAAPAGVALLATSEAEQRSDVTWGESPHDSRPDAVERAARAVGDLTFGQLMAAALGAAYRLAGPWTGGAPRELVDAYRFAEARRPIADAISQRFGAHLHAEVGLLDQQWWTDDTSQGGWSGQPLFAGFERVYGNGELTFDGLWTVSDPPAETHQDLVDTWEMFDRPMSRWRLPVRDDVRVWEIHQPSDWVALVRAYPKVATRAHEGWELPGPKQDAWAIRDLVAIPAQHAARSMIGRHLLPDWAAIARDHDGVHLSWAGFLTSEGYVGDVGAGAVTMLRYWFSERTLWLADVFGDPEPMAGQDLPESPRGSVDIRVDHARRRQDRAALETMLGR